MTDFTRAAAAPSMIEAAGNQSVRTAVVAEQPHEAQIKQVAVQFEGMFIAQMLGEMRKVAEQLKAGNGFDDRSGDAMLEHAHRIVADSIAHTHAFGIADTLIAQLQHIRGDAAGTGRTDRSHSS